KKRSNEMRTPKPRNISINTTRKQVTPKKLNQSTLTRTIRTKEANYYHFHQHLTIRAPIIHELQHPLTENLASR
ncbi:MAG: hypothetical protein QXH05_02180, partial [Thermosphaera sp.]